MRETLDELLKKFILKSNITFYVFNEAENVEDYYDLDELTNYGHYMVNEWCFNCETQTLHISIERELYRYEN